MLLNRFLANFIFICSLLQIGDIYLHAELGDQPQEYGRFLATYQEIEQRLSLPSLRIRNMTSDNKLGRYLYCRHCEVASNEDPDDDEDYSSSIDTDKKDYI